ncbi:MAG TPA: cytochrome c-type biogenesis protein CcmH [Gemmatimonadales bacterium]|jgi:cytochrome c-type biogenesis protein CcmH|nr:cytochrome c-type biogenesis protein CcmH [Gemmatimonadales bacterium]
MTTRRAILAGGLTLGLARLLGAQDSLAGRGATGTLRDPGAAGRPHDPSTPRDNDPFVYAVEHRIKCQCGCNLDVYTCRTTDFTCQTSPAMHRAVLELQDQGKTEQQIVDAFVAKYGEKALMAPVPKGFNLAGYLVPGILMALAGIALTAYLMRRSRVAASAAASAPTVPAFTPIDGATPEELERLHRAMAEDED